MGFNTPPYKTKYLMISQWGSCKEKQPINKPLHFHSLKEEPAQQVEAWYQNYH